MNELNVESSFLQNDNWLGCLDNDDMDDPYQLINEVMMDSNFPNDGFSFLSPDNTAINTNFGYDNFSESNSSDSGNYSPKSLSSEQHPSSIKCHSSFPNHSSPNRECNFVIPDEQFQCDLIENFPNSEESDSRDRNFDNFVLPSSLNSNNKNDCINNELDSLNSSSVTFVEQPLLHSPSPVMISPASSNQQSQQVVYIMRDPPPSSAQFVTVPYISSVQSVRTAQIAPVALTEVCSTSSMNLQAAPMKFYMNKRPIPRANNNYVQTATNSVVAEDEFLKRKEDRKLRNRAAAQLSRQRKRTEFEQLKCQLDEKENLCKILKDENETLKKRIVLLEKENKRLLEDNSIKPLKRQYLQSFNNSNNDLGLETRKKAFAKTAGGVCALVFMAFMVFPSTNYFESGPLRFYVNSNNDISDNYINEDNFETQMVKISHVGRSLSIIENDYMNLTNQSYSNATNFPLAAMNINNTNFIECSNTAFFDANQNAKLNMDLFNWIDRHDQMNFVQLRRGKSPSLIFNGRLTTNSMLEAQRELSKIFTKTHANTGRIKQTNSTDSDSNSKLLKKRFEKQKLFSRNNGTNSSRKSKIEAARNRAWKHLDMISTEQTLNENYSINGTEVRNSLSDQGLRLGPIRNPKNFSLFSIKNADLKLNTGIQRETMDFISKIKQKDDTLYIVALKFWGTEEKFSIVFSVFNGKILQDYFLLPALERNSTKLAPKISIILPALSYSSIPSQIAMMRIECNVMATSMFFLPEATVSLFNSSPPSY